MGEVKVVCHNLSPTSYRLTFFWFHVNSPSYYYDKAFFKFGLQNRRSKSADSHTLGKHPIDSYLFRSMLIGPSLPEILLFK